MVTRKGLDKAEKTSGERRVRLASTADLHTRFRSGTFLRHWWRLADESVQRGSLLTLLVPHWAYLRAPDTLLISFTESTDATTMFPTLRLAGKADRSAFKAALKNVSQHQPAPVNQPLRPAKPLMEQLTGEPASKQTVSDRQTAAAKGKNKSIVDSFRCE